MNPPSEYRTGIGFDAHELRKGRKLVLGGVEVPAAKGLVGHSDADVLLHALTDALLGALALPDIGTLFPDTDPKWKDADSGRMLRGACARVKARGYGIENCDLVVVCDQPKLKPHAETIRKSVARLLGVTSSVVGLQAKTTEGTRLAIPGKSVAAFASVLVSRSGR